MNVSPEKLLEIENALVRQEVSPALLFMVLSTQCFREGVAVTPNVILELAEAKRQRLNKMDFPKVGMTEAACEKVIELLRNYQTDH